jgi:hypothetical protein
MYALQEYLINRERDYLQSSREYSSQTATEFSVLLRMIFHNSVRCWLAQSSSGSRQWTSSSNKTYIVQLDKKKVHVMFQKKYVFHV